MIGKIIGSVIGERVGARYGAGAKGALLGAIAPAVARRLFTPIGLALVGAYAAKKIFDRRQTRKATTTQAPYTPI